MSSTSTLLVSLLLLVLGLWVGVWLALAIVSPFLGKRSFLGKGKAPLRFPFSAGGIQGFSERWRFRRSVRTLLEIEHALAAENFSLAQRLIPKALSLDWIEHTPDLIAKGSHHNLEILNKLIIVAERQAGSVKNLPKLESLFGKRTEILSNAFDTRLARKRFKEKQRGKGKNPPRWSTKEFDTRLQDLRREWEAFQKEVGEEVRKALSLLREPSRTDGSETHYH